MKRWNAAFFRSQTPEGTRFRAGIILILASFPTGWFGSLAAYSLLAKRSDTWFVIAAASAVYAFSWILLAAGVWLARKRGLVMARRLWRIITGHRKDAP